MCMYSKTLVKNQERSHLSSSSRQIDLLAAVQPQDTTKCLNIAPGFRDEFKHLGVQIARRDSWTAPFEALLPRPMDAFDFPACLGLVTRPRFGLPCGTVAVLVRLTSDKRAAHNIMVVVACYTIMIVHAHDCVVFFASEPQRTVQHITVQTSAVCV